MKKVFCLVIALIALLLAVVVLSQAKSPMANEKSMGKGDAMAGKQTYMDKCARCHGETGKGNGKGVLGVFKKSMHDWTEPGFLAKWNDQDLLKIISEGGEAMGKNKNMPAYGKGKAKKPEDTLTDEQIHNVIAYIRTLAK